MPSLTTLPELQERLRRLPPGAVVGIEGCIGSGKSHLANELRALLACRAIHTDECVAPGDESLPYVDRLNYDQLRSSLCQPIVASVILVEGICLRHVLSRIEVAPALFVYVKRIAESGLWHDGFHLEDYEADNQNAAQEPQRSDLHYHARERPHERAELEVHRSEYPSAL